MTAQMDIDVRSTIEDRLRDIDGVIHATVDPRSQDVWIVRDTNHEQAPVELAVRNRLAALGHQLAGQIHVSLAQAAGPRRRVRFLDVQREEDSRSVAFTVRLEWKDAVHTGHASSEKGAGFELRTAALATLDAVEMICGEKLGLRIIGVKQIHAFDSDLVVASLLRDDGVHQRLVGAVVVTDDPVSTAAIAVLSALNRTLGNFIHTPD